MRYTNKHDFIIVPFSKFLRSAMMGSSKTACCGARRLCNIGRAIWRHPHIDHPLISPGGETTETSLISKKWISREENTETEVI